MREILFKAKRLDNGEWVFGGTLVQFKDAGVLSAFMPAAFNTCVCEHDNETDDILSFSECRFYKIDPETVCQYTGEEIFQNENTKPCFESVKVWENDLIAIYAITYDDDDTPVRKRIAVVKVEWDDTYKMLFAQCVEGDMDTIARECDISYLDSSSDYPFTFWLEYMENSAGKWREWEVIGNIHDKEGTE